MTDGAFVTRTNGIRYRYTIERRDLTDDDPDYLDGWWWCLVRTDSESGHRKVDAYATDAADAAKCAATSRVFANAAAARADAAQWFAEALHRNEGSAPCA